MFCTICKYISHIYLYIYLYILFIGWGGLIELEQSCGQLIILRTYLWACASSKKDLPSNERTSSLHHDLLLREDVLLLASVHDVLLT